MSFKTVGRKKRRVEYQITEKLKTNHTFHCQKSSPAYPNKPRYYILDNSEHSDCPLVVQINGGRKCSHLHKHTGATGVGGSLLMYKVSDRGRKNSVKCTMYYTLHSFSLKLCSATIDLKTQCSVKKFNNKNGHDPASLRACCRKVISPGFLPSPIWISLRQYCISLAFVSLFISKQRHSFLRNII